MVRNAKNGYKGNFFIQFSFSFASVGVGHDLRAAVDSSKGGFGTLEAADENKIWLSVFLWQRGSCLQPRKPTLQTRWLPEGR
jgi:hypothetical protein